MNGKEITVKLTAFAQAKTLLGLSEDSIICSTEQTPLEILSQKFPQQIEELQNSRVAINMEFHPWDAPIGEASEISIIPPVSGG